MKFNKKLSLNKETISNLNDDEMGNLKGGDNTDGGANQGILTLIGSTCKKTAECNPTRCGDANTTNTVSGNCTCPEACNQG